MVAVVGALCAGGTADAQEANPAGAPQASAAPGAQPAGNPSAANAHASEEPSAKGPSQDGPPQNPQGQAAETPSAQSPQAQAAATGAAAAAPAQASGTTPQQPTADAGSAPAQAPAPQEAEGPSTEPSVSQTTEASAHSLDATGYMLKAWQAELGLFFMGLGITDWLSVGTQPVPWFIGPIVHGSSFNVAVRLGIPIGPWFNLAIEATPIWFRYERDNTDNSALLLPITLGASVHPLPQWSFSAAGRFTNVSGSDQSSVQQQEVGGTAITRVFQVLLEAQYQLTRTVGLYVRGYVQPWSQNLRVNADLTADENTTVNVEADASAAEKRVPVAGLVGAHLRWGIVNLRIGLGYGNFFLPRLGLSVGTYTGIFPDLDLFVRF